MRENSGDKRVVSIPVLVAAMRREYMSESNIGRVLVAALDLDEATARVYAEGRVPVVEEAVDEDATVIEEAPVVEEAETVEEAEMVEEVPVADLSEISDFATLHTRLTAAQERGDWAAFVALIHRIVEIESDDKRRAKYYYTLGLIQRDQIKDLEAAVESLEMALDCDSTLLAAFERIKSIYTGQANWKGLERSHRKMIRRVRGVDANLDFGLWQALAQIYRDRLNDSSAAVAAFKMALALRPEDAETLAAVEALGG